MPSAGATGALGGGMRPSDSPNVRRALASLAPWIAFGLLLAATVVLLRLQGRTWWCECGGSSLWSGDIWSSHNSQHLFDAYSFSHLQHGILLYGLLAWLCPRVSPAWRLFLAACVEVAWEVSENTQFMIDRYRESTISLGYNGDSIANSFGDVVSFVFGFAVARRLGFWPSVAALVVVEAAMVVLYRDSLLLNTLMLIHPIEAVKDWQTPA